MGPSTRRLGNQIDSYRGRGGLSAVSEMEPFPKDTKLTRLHNNFHFGCNSIPAGYTCSALAFRIHVRLLGQPKGRLRALTGEPRTVSRQDQLSPPEIDSGPLDRSADDIRLQINLRFNLDEVTDVEAKQLCDCARRRPTKRELTRLACQIYDSRRARDRVLDRRLFGEPGWDMLLALYALPTRGELLTVTGLNYAADVPQSTGLRWQQTLREEGLVERGPASVDARKQMLRLTIKGRTLMEQYLQRLFYCETPVPPHPEAAGG